MKTIQTILTICCYAHSFGCLGQYVSSNIEHYNTLNQTFFKAIIDAHGEFVPNDTLWFEFGEGGPPVKTVKTDVHELGNGVVRSEYELSHVYAGAGLFSATLLDSNANFIFQNHQLIESVYFSTSQVARLPLSSGHNSILFEDYLVKHVNPGNELVLNPIASINLSQQLPSQIGTPSMTFELNEYPNISEYQVPEGMSIHPLTGEIRWDVPETASGMYELIIEVHKDEIIYGSMNIKRLVFNVSDTMPEGLSYSNTENWNTDADGYYEYHIPPNENFQLSFNSEHAFADSIYVKSHSEIYEDENNGFYQNEVTSDGGLTTSFEWTPDDSHVRPYPYVLHFVPYFVFNGYTYYDFITVAIYVDETTNVTESFGNRINIYPNPITDGQIQISAPQDIVGASVTVFDITCQLVSVSSLQANQNTINVSALSPGIYFIKVVSGNTLLGVEKLVVQLD